MHVCVHLHTIVSSTMQAGASPLYVASRNGHSMVVNSLVKSGADPNLARTVWKLVCFVFCLLLYCSTSMNKISNNVGRCRGGNHKIM